MKNKLAQALLFCGPRGVGKTSCARIVAKKINSQGRVNPNEDFAFNIFELDAASNNSVDDIRSLNEKVRIPPQIGTYKVYICLLYTSPSPRDRQKSRMPSSA